jgi:hypothetical protein
VRKEIGEIMNTEIIAELLNYGEYLEELNDDNLIKEIVDYNGVQNWISGVVMILEEILAEES